MTNEQRQFTAQSQTFPVILVRKKVKNINLHIRSDGTLYISAHRSYSCLRRQFITG